jgi:hypothetical protein
MAEFCFSMRGCTFTTAATAATHFPNLCQQCLQDNHLYYEIEINGLGAVWDLLLAKPYRWAAGAIMAASCKQHLAWTLLV